MTPEMCLAIAIYFEARGEIPDGQIAVAETIVNRVEDPRWPDTICGVVQENRYPDRLHACQFSFYCDGQPERPSDARAWDMAQGIANGVLEGTLSLGVPATHYHTIHVSPSWSESMLALGRIGEHLFYLEGDLE